MPPNNEKENKPSAEKSKSSKPRPSLRASKSEIVVNKTKTKKPTVKIPDIFRLMRKRKSTRNFKKFQLDNSALATVKSALKSVKVLHKGMKFEWEIDAASPLGSGRIFAAPDAGKKSVGKSASPELLVEYGFQGEAIVLGLTKLDYGTCWIATGKAAVSGSPAVVVFGKADDKGIIAKAIGLVIGSNRRKSLEEVLDPEGELPSIEQTRVIDAMRIAPSAVNRQPWLFKVVGKKEITVVKLKGHQLWTYIDLGIALFHGFAAAAALFKKAKVTRVDSETYSLSW